MQMRAHRSWFLADDQGYLVCGVAFDIEEVQSCPLCFREAGYSLSQMLHVFVGKTAGAFHRHRFIKRHVLAFSNISV